jgi:Bacterial SH3 domain
MHDDQLTQLLRQIDEPAEPDAAFADRLFETLSRQTGRSSGMRMTLLLVAAVMLVAVLAVGAVVGSGLVKLPWFTVQVSPAPSGVFIASESASPTSAQSATPEATPTPLPTPVVAVPDGILPPGSKATVLVDGLRVRNQPSTSAPVLNTLAKGDTVTILHNITVPVPVIVDGVPWYAIPITSNPYTGWVAAEQGGTPFLALAEPTTCEDLRTGPVTLETLIAADSWHRLACLGDASVTVTGVYVTSCQGGAGMPGQPVWLFSDWCQAQVLTPKDGAKNFPTTGLSTVAAPSLNNLSENPGTLARVTGHFDDPASASCVITGGYERDNGLTAQGSGVVLDCREQFVVTKIEVLGSVTLPPI